MKALILNSGTGSRMGDITKAHPKCMTEINNHETILSYQLRLLQKYNVNDVVITTGKFSTLLEDYCLNLGLKLNYIFVNNPSYQETNYIYSIALATEVLDDDIILMHGDLVFEDTVLENILYAGYSCMAVSSTTPLPQKDFKAVVHSENDKIRISKVGIEFFDSSMAAQPLYYLKKEDWKIWLAEINRFCEMGVRTCYAENALNAINSQCNLFAYDMKDLLCAEVDTVEDLKKVQERLQQ